MNKPIQILIASHNNRIQYILNSLLYDGTRKKIKIRFMNCAMLKIIITKQNTTINLVYQGELSEKEMLKISPTRQYYITPNIQSNIDYINNIDNLIPFLEQTVPTKSTYSNMMNDSTSYVIYIVRHGQAEHNVPEFLNNLKQDTNLTLEGKNQVNRLIPSISNNDKENLKLIDYYFVSDLKRTHQTIELILNTIFNEPNLYSNNINIHVLPCSHEITKETNGKGNGNEATSTSLYTGQENESSCLNIDTCPTKINNYNLYWNHYKDFYDGTRKQHKSSRSQCRETDMIKLMIKIIKGKEEKNPLKRTQTDIFTSSWKKNVKGGKRKTKRKLCK
jgi:bisphosphoglycerate-dependent phosphoglycerate mutase